MFNTLVNVSFQELAAWLHYPMLFFTAFGHENIYLIVMAFLYWCVNDKLGIRVGIMLLTSSAVSSTLKILFHTPRPYWVDSKVIAYTTETSFGFPSGHALMSSATYGRIAINIKEKILKFSAFVFIFIIGFSRIFLGVHFLGDVIGGWFFGVLLLALGLFLEKSATQFFSKQSGIIKILFGLIASMTMITVFSIINHLVLIDWIMPTSWMNGQQGAAMELPNPFESSGIWTVAGSLFGMITGRVMINNFGGFSTKVANPQKVLRLLLGMIGVFILWLGLGKLFPSDESIFALVLRYIRYALVGFWISGGAPWLFRKIEKDS